MQERGLVVVTGASAGIGKAVASAFAKEGHPVLLVARHVAPIAALHGTPVATAALDVADAGAFAAAVAAAEVQFGATACLVNNAGLLRVGALEDRAMADFGTEIDVLLKGVVAGTKAVLPGMIARKAGTIINVSSIGDRKPGPSAEIYHACKAAVRSLGESLQQAEAKHNIRVINVAPGFIKTNIHEQMGITFAEYCARLRPGGPAGDNPTFICAEELADIMLFCWKQPPHICIRDIVVMPTTSGY